MTIFSSVTQFRIIESSAKFYIKYWRVYYSQNISNRSEYISSYSEVINRIFDKVGILKIKTHLPKYPKDG